DQLRAVLAALAELAGPPAPHVTIDLGDLRGFGYYTGVRFAAYAGGAPDAVLRGGRYDELIGRYGRAARATGFAIDLEAVAQAHPSEPPRPPGVATDDPALARALRAAGVRAACQRPPEAGWSAWLRGAGLDAAIVGDELHGGDGSRRDARAAIEAARAGDTRPLIALLT
ncbi:MAG TPA: ATP phosphoribosyltransferase regulatory subunit, partial [Kofleriaceae bacterium]|nr:ATP phosphoribosyltransferase regulatory subunit [Kofleriaceae bacterium]